MHRILIADTPLGDAWWAVRMNGTEALSQLYAFRLELKSHHNDIDLQALIGEPVAIACEANHQTVRYFSGQVNHAAILGKNGKHWAYTLNIGPKLWYASRRADYKIYQHRSIQSIADEVLQQNGIHYEWRLKNAYAPREYIVQYGETDLAFLLRLLSSEGIFFWFEHGPGGEILLLGDHFSIHEPFPGYADIPYYPPDASRVNEDHFRTWHAGRQPEPGNFVQRDYDFKRPALDLTTESKDPRGHLFDQYEIYAWPGDYTDPEQGRGSARARLERLQGEQDTIHLEGTVRGAVPGYCFNLTRAPVESQNRQFTITQATYEAANNEYESGTDNEEGARFHVRVAAIPSDRQYRPPEQHRQTPRVSGPETAVVVGPSGSEIHTDEYGRIKVHFHWDRYGQYDGNDSCWIRVVTPWAGGNFGSVAIPRIGHEVLIDYEHGDPQRPVVVGSVYNAHQMPPWALPANKTQTGILSRSSPGGGASNANALRFEDKKGKEELWIQAERDRRLHVKRNDSTSVGGDRSQSVGGQHTESVRKDIAVASIEGTIAHTAGRSIVLQATEQIVFKVGASIIVMTADGTILIDGPQRVDINPGGGDGGEGGEGSSGGGSSGGGGGGSSFAPTASPAPAAASSAPAAASSDPLADPKVQEIVAKSPTLQKDLAELKNGGWTIKYGPAGAGSSASRNDKHIITIDGNRRNNPADAVRSISHETGHALYPHTPDYSSKTAYVNGYLADEGAATLKNIEVQREILANGGPNIGISGNSANHPAYNSAYDQYRRTGDAAAARAAIGNTYRTGEKTPNGKTYGDQHGDHYDSKIVPWLNSTRRP